MSVGSSRVLPAADRDTFPVRVWIVEAAELQRTPWTCLPRTWPAGAVLGASAWFDTEKTFLDSVHQAFAKMLLAPGGQRHLLIISAHGRQMTGTHLTFSKDGRIRLDEHADFFAIRPAGLVTIVSACWGGYPTVLSALCAGDATEPALVIAPLVDIDPDDINNVQADVISAMIHAHDLDEALRALVVGHDVELQEKHAEPALRIVLRDGSMLPPVGAGGLAAPMEAAASYRVVALQRMTGNNCEPPGLAVLQAPDGGFWRASVSSISDAESEADVYALQGDIVTIRGKRLRYAESAALGELIEVVPVPIPGKVKSRPMPPPPYAHSTERTTAKAAQVTRAIEHGSLKKCKRCNWASYGFVSVKRDGKVEHTAEAVCHRETCGEHGKW